MRRFFAVALMSGHVFACTPAPTSLNDEPTRITPVDYFILRASQAAAAETLAQFCPRYRFDTAKEAQLKKSVIAQIEGDKTLQEAAEFIQALVPKAAPETRRYALEYQRRNKLDQGSTADDYCRVADKEVAAQSVIGQLLKR